MLLLFAGLSSATGGPSAPRLVVTSGEDRVTLLELYTSEGCSSCPPADRWLSARVDDPGLWTSFVPIALHVDYWDYIGWPDRFAIDGNSDRQRGLAAQQGRSSIYTPGVFSNGQEWLGWRRGESVPGPGSKAGNLTVRLDDDRLEIEFRPATQPAGELVVNVGVLGMKLFSEVRAGENRGRRLEHDFVLLSLQTTPLLQRGSGDTYRAELTVGPAAVAPNALVAWVAGDDRLAPLQAAGGFVSSQ